MKKTKAEKGITLVALIITIIVLLILAVVAINAVRNDGIIDYAKNARYGYQNAQVAENDLLQKYMNDIKESIPTIKIITFTIDETEHSAEEGMTWKQWIGSKYNVNKYYIESNNIFKKEEFYSLRNENNSDYIYSTEKIEEGEQYTFVDHFRTPNDEF